ncbi:unnamed protein product, partial [Sphacelaria rigidula]
QPTTLLPAACVPIHSSSRLPLFQANGFPSGQKPTVRCSSASTAEHGKPPRKPLRWYVSDKVISNHRDVPHARAEPSWSGEGHHFVEVKGVAHAQSASHRDAAPRSSGRGRSDGGV